MIESSKTIARESSSLTIFQRRRTKCQRLFEHGNGFAFINIHPLSHGKKKPGRSLGISLYILGRLGRCKRPKCHFLALVEFFSFPERPGTVNCFFQNGSITCFSLEGKQLRHSISITDERHSFPRLSSPFVRFFLSLSLSSAYCLTSALAGEQSSLEVLYSRKQREIFRQNEPR